MTQEASDNGAICLDLLREIDRDRYLACLLSPADKRPAIAALYAFSAELARIRDLVREPLPGEIRLQYWRDLLDGKGHGSTEANPVAAGLLAAIERYRLPLAPLQAMVEARLFDLYDDPIETRGMLEGYAGETASALIQLTGLVLDPADAARHAETAGHAGIAQAIAGLILLMPLHRRRGQLYLPLELLSAVGLDREAFLAGEDRQRIGAAIEAFAGLAREHLEKARRAGRPSPSLAPAFLTATLAAPVLDRAARAGADGLDRDLRPSQLRRQWRMLRFLMLRRL
ncbi:phytoene/squalene synthase family protein [Ciceribacter sp. L1K23]|uniref:phytoene/squalene synthase family protein n=1 Tax=Ciceribacter sp. L1K23 TaxID=2820276 RepID=UPI001B83BEFB|nr:phytoene/squalene synthase family protein [Ciceribacter sp. L1K23]